MRVVLTGADFEENLGIGMIAAALAGAGHQVEVVPFGTLGELEPVATAILARAPDLVGLSLQFQHRAPDFLGLARRLRERGFGGHITCGGQLPTLAWHELLADGHGLDSIVLHEGERTVVELVAALAEGAPLAGVPGLALAGVPGLALAGVPGLALAGVPGLALAGVPGLALAGGPGLALAGGPELALAGVPERAAGRPFLTAPRRTLDVDLDALPFPVRYRPHTRHAGVPFVPILGGRGCWGACRFCAISSFHRDARARGGGGPTVRLRGPENLAAEMALLAHEAGGAAIFCFHDDNFLLPRPADSLARLRALRAALDAYGVGPVALVGKTRPGCLTRELAAELRELGVVRLYVGVENASARGAANLGRANQHAHIHDAIEACGEAGINACYNLLLFEPGATLDDVRENVAFIRAHAEHPVNFCRAEPYVGTPLHRDLVAAGALEGGYLGWGYRIADAATELCFRVSAAAFRQRNFDPVGVANRYMSLNYTARVLDRFLVGAARARAELSHRARELTRAISLETADLLEEAAGLAAAYVGHGEDRDALERGTALLGLRVAASDAVWHRAMDELFGEMDAVARAGRAGGAGALAGAGAGAGAGAAANTPGGAAPSGRPRGALLERARQMALGATLAVWASGCGRADRPAIVDPAPPDGGAIMVPDPPPPPPDAAQPREPIMVLDPPPPPPDAAPARRDTWPVDPPPPSPPPDAAGKKPKVRPPEPPPPVCDPLPPDPRPDRRSTDPGTSASLPIDGWRDSGLAAPARSSDLPLHCPPSVKLLGEHAESSSVAGIAVRVRLAGAPSEVSLGWEAEGGVEGDGREVTWYPASPGAQIRVAVRAVGGVAVAALRASDVVG